jgi:DNA-binding transcriptional LysR family regulator
VDLRAIEIFLTVCDSGGMTAAAGTLNISQAGVSQRIAQLERELGTELFDRTARPQRLTPAGVVLREKAKRISVDMQDLLHTLERYRDVEIPELRIGIVESVASALVPRLVPQIEHFASKLTITSSILGALVPEIARGNLDIIITSERMSPSFGLEHHALIAEPFVCLLPDGVEPPTSPQQLGRLADQLPYVGFGNQDRIGAVNRELARCGVTIRGSLHHVSLATLVDLVRQGKAWTIITPLCLYSARAPVEGLSVAPLPCMKFSRLISLAAPERKLGEVPKKISVICNDILAEHVVPVLKRYVPFSLDQIVFGKASRPPHDDPPEQTESYAVPY